MSGNESFTSAPQLKRGPLGGALMPVRSEDSTMPGSKTGLARPAFSLAKARRLVWEYGRLMHGYGLAPTPATKRAADGAEAVLIAALTRPPTQDETHRNLAAARMAIRRDRQESARLRKQLAELRSQVAVLERRYHSLFKVAQPPTKEQLMALSRLFGRGRCPVPSCGFTYDLHDPAFAAFLQHVASHIRQPRWKSTDALYHRLPGSYGSGKRR